MSQIYARFADYLKENYAGPYCATDTIIRYKGGVVLIERKNPPHGIALPGGFAEYMQLHENAVKENKEETNLRVVIDKPYHRPFFISSKVNQDPRAFIMAVTYTGEGFGELKPHPLEDAKRAFCVSHTELDDLLKQDVWAFDHHKDALRAYLNVVNQLGGAYEPKVLQYAGCNWKV
jgi:8-oxo-dGTP diphosphatase